MVSDRHDHDTTVQPGTRAASAPVRPSTVTLPEQRPEGVRTLLDFVVRRFPNITPATWQARFAAGEVWTTSGPVAAADPYRPLLELHYRREVANEPPVREDLRVVWSDRALMVVDKPPNLPVTPGGRWVRNCLLHLIAEATGTTMVTPLHRLDRLTSGLVLLCLEPEARSHYGRLFQPTPLVDKVYTAVSEIRREPPGRCFELAHHIARSPVEHWRQVVRPGAPANAHCEVELLETRDDLALLRLRPSTGRKHQLRVQLAATGLPVLGDPLYGTEPSDGPDDGSRRLWLDGHRLGIHGFAGADGVTLDAVWTSSREPGSFFGRALRVRRHGSPEG